MADRTIPVGDTYPPLLVRVADEDGLVDLTLADTVELEAKSATALITGAMTVLDPPVTVTIDGAQVQMNAQYAFAAADTAAADEYTIRAKVTWDATATPPTVEHFPNATANADRLIVEAI